MDHRGRFLPDRLRPPKLGRRSRRGLVLASAVPLMVLALPLWRVDSVVVEGCSKLPPAAIDGLDALAGQPALGLDVEAIRDAVKAWPGVGEVQVELELPGTLRVRAAEAPTLGSVRVGQGWHGVDAAGRLTGVTPVPVEPILEGFTDDVERARGLAAAQRVAVAATVSVHGVRRVTPHDYELQLVRPDDAAPTVVHVAPEGTVAEQAWTAAFAGGTVIHRWADLRRSDRIVVGSAHE